MVACLGIMLVGCVTVIPRGVGPVWFLVMCKMGNKAIVSFCYMCDRCLVVSSMSLIFYC